MLELFKERRSLRVFNEREVEGEKIEKILEAGSLAPSGKNKKPWEFISVTDKKVLDELSKAKSKGGLFIKDCGVGIVVLGDEERSDTWIEDCSIATTFMQLEAQKLGLGSCWAQIRARVDSNNVDAELNVRNILNIEKNQRVLCILAIGYPKL